MMGMQSWG